MRRSLLLPATLTLALATATALLGAATLLTEPPPTARAAPIAATADDDSPLARANIALVGRFYAAVNRAVWTGDPTALDRLIAPDLVDHTARPGDAGTRADLYRRLLTLHATVPALQLTATDLGADGDLVAARVTASGAERRVFTGVPSLPDQGVWATLDLFRVSGGRIVERWGDPGGPSSLQPLLHTALTVPRAEAVHVRLERLTLPPGGQVRLERGPICRAVAVEAGSLRAYATGDDGAPPAAASQALHDAPPAPPKESQEAGGALVLARGVAAELRNEGAISAVALMATVDVSMMPGAASGEPQATGSGPLRSRAGTSIQVLARGTFAPSPDVAPSLGLARFELEPGGELLIPAATDSTLFVVETGLASVAPGAADRPPDGSGDGALLHPGAAIATTPETPTTLRNAGARPLVLLVATIGPANDRKEEARTTD